MAYRFQLRRATSATWKAVNPVLMEGEPGLEINTLKVKYGDGITAWKDLPYWTGGGVELRNNGTAIQWRHEGEAWQDLADLVDLSRPIDIKGVAQTLGELPSTAPTGEVWLLDGHLYAFDGTTWLDQGILPGIIGPQGPQGAEGPAGTGINIKGIAENAADLPTSATLGDA